jgi:hypothetical protein
VRPRPNRRDVAYSSGSPGMGREMADTPSSSAMLEMSTCKRERVRNNLARARKGDRDYKKRCRPNAKKGVYKLRSYLKSRIDPEASVTCERHQLVFVINLQSRFWPASRHTIPQNTTVCWLPATGTDRASVELQSHVISSFSMTGDTAVISSRHKGCIVVISSHNDKSLARRTSAFRREQHTWGRSLSISEIFNGYLPCCSTSFLGV